MVDLYATDFTEIPAVLSRNAELRTAVERLIQPEPIPGKALEGANRLGAFRSVLRELINGSINLEQAYARTERDLPRASSPYAPSNLVFPLGVGRASRAHAPQPVLQSGRHGEPARRRLRQVFCTTLNG